MFMSWCPTGPKSTYLLFPRPHNGTGCYVNESVPELIYALLNFMGVNGLQKTLNGFPCCLGEGLLFYLFWALEGFGSNYKLGDPPSTVGTASPVHPTCSGGQKYSLMKYSNTFCGTSDQVAGFRTVCRSVQPEVLVNRANGNRQKLPKQLMGMRSPFTKEEETPRRKGNLKNG